ncbi:MAG: hypothetical protein ACYTXA_16535 [Nostoc sp.]
MLPEIIALGLQVFVNFVMPRLSYREVQHPKVKASYFSTEITLLLANIDFPRN